MSFVNDFFEIFDTSVENKIILDVYVGLIALGIIMVLAGCLYHLGGSTGTINMFGIQMVSVINTNLINLSVTGIGAFIMCYSALSMRRKIESMRSGEE